MRIFHKEIAQDYSNYTFAYASLCVAQGGDKFSEIYRLGFLPYSAKQGVKNIFYMARSGRIALRDWQPNSENRRILAKNISTECRQVSEANLAEFTEYKKLLLEYFAAKHGAEVMPEWRLETILAHPSVKSLKAYYENDQLLGGVIEAGDVTATHYWFSFYRLELLSRNFGLFMMIDCAQRTKKAGGEYLYVGTLYGEKARYKTNFENFEYWDGSEWQTNKKVLLSRMKNDDGRKLNTTEDIYAFQE